MALQSINLGVAPSGAGGDAARTAFEKMNANFSNPAHAASKLAQSSPTDTTVGALMAVGAFGLGATSGLGFEDANLAVVTGAYRLSGTSANRPEVGGFGYALDVVSYAYAFTWQRASRPNGAGVASFVRWQNGNGIWSAWHPDYNAGNILGPVSHSGGVPTGAIIDRGNNTNGEYTRYADGTIEAWHLMSLVHVANAELITQWDLPAAISTIAGSQIFLNVRGVASTNLYSTTKLQGAVMSATAAQLRTQFSAGQAYSLSLYLKGRWY